MLRLREQSEATNLAAAEDRRITEAANKGREASQTEANVIDKLQVKQTGAYQTETNRLRGQEIQNSAAALKANIESNRANQSLRGKEIAVAEGRLQLEQDLKQSQLDASKAAVSNNTALAKVHEADAVLKEQKNLIVSQYINGDNSNIVKSIAEDALGLNGNEAQERLNRKEIMDIKVAINENKDDESLLPILFERLYESDPKATEIWYYTSGFWRDNQATSAKLPVFKGVQLTVEDILFSARKKGVSVEQVLKDLGAVE